MCVGAGIGQRGRQARKRAHDAVAWNSAGKGEEFSQKVVRKGTAGL